MVNWAERKKTVPTRGLGELATNRSRTVLTKVGKQGQFLKLTRKMATPKVTKKRMTDMRKTSGT